jgi:hypothetical protein
MTWISASAWESFFAIGNAGVVSARSWNCSMPADAIASRYPVLIPHIYNIHPSNDREKHPPVYKHEQENICRLSHRIVSYHQILIQHAITTMTATVHQVRPMSALSCASAPLTTSPQQVLLYVTLFHFAATSNTLPFPTL